MKKLLLLLAFLGIISCSEKKDFVKTDPSNDLTVQSAKEWFTENSGYKSRARQADKKDRFSGIDVQWEKAQKGKSKNGESYIEIPLRYSKKTKWFYRIAGPKKGNDSVTIASNVVISLIIYQKDGKKFENIKELRYDEGYLSDLNNGSTKTTFTGKILLWSWAGELLGGSVYKDGVRQGIIKPVTPTKNGRVNITCDVYTECHWSAGCQEGEDYDPWDGWGVGPVVIGTHTTSNGYSCQYPTYGPGLRTSGCGTWELTLSRTYEICRPDGSDSPGGSEGSGSSDPYNLAFAQAVRNQLTNKPLGLLTADCETLKRWLALAKFTPSQSIINKLNSVVGHTSGGTGYGTTISANDVANVQYLNGAVSPVVNMDYFPVLVTEMPDGFTPQQLLNYVRLNINSFLDGTKSFYPYNAYGVNDTNTWNSSNPTGAIVAIDLPGPENGSVITSSSAPDQWIFTTIHEPMYGDHPVSGNRAFGYTIYQDGTITFYTMGVDRLTNWLGTAAQVIPEYFKEGAGIPFSQADIMWGTFQEKLLRFVQDHGGRGYTRAKQVQRPDWNLIKDVVEGRKPMSSLNKDCQ